MFQLPFSVSIALPCITDTPLIGISDGFCHLSGYTREEIVGQNCRFLLKGVPEDEVNSTTVTGALITTTLSSTTTTTNPASLTTTLSLKNLTVEAWTAISVLAFIGLWVSFSCFFNPFVGSEAPNPCG